MPEFSSLVMQGHLIDELREGEQKMFQVVQHQWKRHVTYDVILRSKGRKIDQAKGLKMEEISAWLLDRQTW